MDINETIELTVFIHELYQDRFPKLTPQMARIWYDDLRRYNEGDAEAAVRQWARQHTLKAPSLDELCETIEFMTEERRRTRPHLPGGHTIQEALREAAFAQERNPERSEDEASYGHLLATIGERSVAPWVDAHGVGHDKLTLEERATQCYEWANQYQPQRPALAKDLRHAARLFARLYHEEEAP